MPLDQDIELVDMPVQGDFKLVQLMLDGDPVMVCGPTSGEDGYHRKILADFLDDRGVEYDTVKRGVPSPKGDRYELVGCGVGGRYTDCNLFQLPDGGSHEYKMRPHPDFKERLRIQFQGWDF